MWKRANMPSAGLGRKRGRHRAGDAFAGTLAACLAREKPLVEAATWANAAAAITDDEARRSDGDAERARAA